MAADNNQNNSPANPLGDSVDSSQQDWMELDQQGLSGETLKAKKWTAKRRVVDNQQHVGNIHTGTEQAAELDKGAPTDSDISLQQTTTVENDQASYAGNHELTTSTNVFQQNSWEHQGEEQRQSATEQTQHVAAESNIAKSAATRDPIFEEHFDEPKEEDRTTEETKSAKAAPQTIIPDPELPTVQVTEVDEEKTTAPQSPEITQPPLSDPPETTPSVGVLPPEEDEVIESDASTPTLSASDAYGSEDTAIPLEIFSGLTDTDGSESLSIIISGVPEGALLSAGQNLGGGNWRLSSSQLDELSITPPADSDDSFSLTIRATSTESHGGKSASVTEIIDVFVEAVADAPILDTKGAIGEEDTAIPLDITSALTDIDGSETLSAITITQVPDDALLSNGIKNPDGSWSLTAQELEDLKITPAEHSHEDFELQLSVTSTDTNGSTATTKANLPVTVTAVNDTATISGDGGSVTEDGGVATDGTVGLNQGDTRGEVLVAQDGGAIIGGNAAISIEMDINITDTPGNEDIPLVSYASDRRHNNEFRLLLKPEDDGQTYTLELKFGGDSRRQKSYSEQIDGEDLFDGNFHSIGVAVDTEGNVQFSFDNQDIGTGTVQPHTLREGGVLVFGQEQDDVGTRFDIQDEFISGQIGDITISSGDATLAHWDMNTIDESGSVGDQSGNGRNLTKTTITNNRDNVLELTGDQIVGHEESNPTGPQSVSGQLTIVDPDLGEDYFAAGTVEGLYGELELNEDGTWTYTLNNDAENVQALDLGDVVTDTISIQSADGTSHDLVMTVNGTNDYPSIDAITETRVTEDGEGVKGLVTATDIDADDSLTFSAETAAGLTFNSDGSYSFDPSHNSYQYLANGETATVSVLVTVTDEHDASDTQNLVFTVTGTNDTPRVSGAVTLPGGTEDTSLTFTEQELLATAKDIDSSDTLQVQNILVDPAYGTLTNNNDGTYTYTPKADYSGEVIVQYDISDGIAATPAIANINLDAVADAPLLTATPATGLEDNNIPLNITTQLTDLDGSETLSAVTITDIPEGALLSAGTENPDGSWTLQANEVSDLHITPPKDSDTDFTLNLEVTATDSNGDTATSTATLPVTVIAVADTPSLRVSDAAGKEDTAIDLNIKSVLTDSDGSESQSITITGVPEGATLSAGTDNEDGSWTLSSEQLDGLQLKPPADSDKDFELEVTTTSSEARDGDTASTTATIKVDLTAVADAPVLEADAAKGKEDTAIELDIKTSLTDLDGSEILSAITISNVPKGATLSVGTDNEDGTWTVTEEELEGLTITAPKDSDEDFELGLSVTATDSNGVTATSTTSLPVTVVAVADTPTLAVSDTKGLEDTAIDLDIKSLLTDTDSSESLAITISGVPGGASLSAGTENRDGSWALTQEQLEGLQIKPPADSDKDFQLEVTATASEARDGDTASTTATIDVAVTAVADAPVLEAEAAKGYEDKEIALDIKTSLTDLDGSETLSAITFSNVPKGAKLSAGVDNEDGTWTVKEGDLEGLTITAPEDSDTDFVLGLSVTATDTNNVTSTTETQLPVTVVAVADAPDVVIEDTSGIEDQAIALSISGSTTDIDGSESIQSITVADVPKGAKLSAGTDNGDGTWSLEQSELNGLTITPPANSNVDFELNVTYVSVEPNGSTASTTETIAVEVTGVADTPVASFDDMKIAEDQTFTLDFSDSLQDRDGSESLSVTFTGIPEGGKFNSGSANADGSWTIDGKDLDNVQFSPPVDSKESFTLNLVATATEDDGDTASTSDSFTVSIDPRADEASFTVKPAMGLEDTAIDLSIGDLQLTDTSGSEVILPDIIISDVPEGAQLSAGVQNSDGTWTLQEEDLEGLQITPPADSNEDFQLKFAVSTQETSNLDTKTTTKTLDVSVTGVSDNTTLATEDSSGIEDTAIALSIDTALIDTDGSETLSLTVGNMPSGATLNHGTDNGDGTWTVAADDIADLSVTPPKHFSGTMDLAITSVATEDDGHSASTSDTITVTVDAVADQAWIAGGGKGDEDTAIDLNLRSGLRDKDGSETFGEITLSGVPEGYVISGGTDNGDGSFSLTHDQLDGLSITPPKDSNEDVNLTLTVETIDANGTSATTSKTIKVDVVGVADAPVADAANVSGTEDQEIALDLNAIGENFGLTDVDGSETLSVKISNVPEGTSFSAGTDNGNGTWSVAPEDVADLVITPPAHFSGTMNLNLESTATENDGDSNTTTVPFSVTVAPVIDAPELEVSDVTGDEDTGISLNIDSGLVDRDGSESYTMLIENVPDGASLSAGTDNGDGSWTLTEGELKDLKITPPADSDTDFSLKLTATTTEKATGESSTVTSDMTVAVNAVADAPELSTRNVRGDEDTNLDLDITSALTDIDGSESLQITIDNVPRGATLSAGTQNSDGSWTLAPDQLTDLKITPPADSDRDFTLNVTATATEAANNDQAVSTAKIKVTLDAVTDAPDLSVEAAAGDEDTKIDLTIDSALTDTDGSESLVIIIDDVPQDVRFTAGSQNEDGSWTLAPADLTGLQVIPAPHSDDDFSLTINAVATETATGKQVITSQSLPVSVTAVADTPLLSLQSVNGVEDTAVDLKISSSLVDSDGSESLLLTVSGMPEGASLSAGTENADGSWTLTGEQLEDLQLTPPANSDVNFALTVTATSTEASNADTASQSYSLPVTLFADPDNLQLSLEQEVIGKEDTAIDLQIDASLIDSDGSETLSVTMEGIPVGAELSAGTDNGDGTWTLNLDQLSDLTITPPKDSDKDFSLTLHATTMELANGQEQTTSLEIPVTVTGVADELTVSDLTSSGIEDQQIPVNLDFALQDTDGSESLSITISDIPDGVKLSAGTENEDGSYTLTPAEYSGLTVTPPADSDADFSLTISATNTEAEGDSRTTTFSHVINVAANADKPELTVESATGAEDSAIALNISPALTDTDGSESLSIIIDDLPTGASLSAGTANSDGSWTLSPAELEGLTVTPAADSDADFKLKVTARSTESDGGDIADTTTSLPVTVTAVTDTPTVSASTAAGDEDSSISLNIEAALSDTDGSESLSLLVEGVPEGASLSAGTANSDGSWTVAQADIADLSILPPKDSNENFELTITAIADEARGDSVASEPITLPVEVTGVADTPDLEVKGTAGDEDTGIALDIKTGLSDTDGSETLTITITGVPEDGSLSAGSANADGSWTLSSDELAELKVHPPAHSDENFVLNVTATATENDGDTSSVSYELPVNVNGVADAPNIEAGAVSGDEDTAIALDLSISPVDLDGSEETLQILVKDVPDGAQLSAGTNHGDGTWTVAHSDIADLKITPPNDSAEDFTLSFDVRSAEKQSGHSTLTSFVVPVAVAAVADGMILSADNAYGRTDQDISLNIHHTPLDSDGSETATFVITDLPEGASLSAGIANADGSWSLTADEMNGLKVTPPAGSSEDFAITVTGTSTEDENGDAISSSISVPVHFRSGGGTGGPGTDTIATKEDTPVKIDVADRIPEVATAADATVTITGIPEGASLSAGVQNSDGSWTVSGDEIADLVLTPAEHSGANMLLSFDAELTDEAGVTTSQDSDLLVTVTDVADAPELSAEAATALEHTATELNISSSLVDRDGSEQLSITISDMPEGATLSAGIDNGDGSWTLEPAQLSGLRITPPRYSDEDFSLKVTATTTEHENGSTASSTFELPVTVTGVADQPLLAVKSVVGDEDTPISLAIDPQLTDTDGSETLSITISDIPDGAMLSTGTANSDGSYTLTPDQLENLTITPSAQSDQDFDLTITATTVEAGSGDSSQSVRSLPVIVNAIADALQVESGPVSSDEDQAIDLGISATVIDTDGSELTSIVADNVPPGATLSAGTRNDDGTWNLTTEQLAGLQVTPPAQSDADFEITFTTTTIESENGHTTTSEFSVPVTVNAVVDGVAIDTGSAAGSEDTAIDLDISATLADQDGSESHVVTVSDVPDGARLTAGTDNGDGSWTVSPAQLNNLKVIPPADSDEDFSLTLTTQSTESGTGETITQSYDIPVTVTAVADRPSLQASSEGGKENEAIGLDIQTALTDTDGSEQLGDIIISGVPEGATLSNGTENSDGTWSLSQDQLVDLQITPPANSDKDISLRVTSTSTEATGDSASATVSLTVKVQAVATDPVVTVTDATGFEDQDIALDISSALADTDGSESLSITIGGVPDGARLSAGTPNEDGSWSVSQDELDGLSIRPPKDSGDDFDLTISATATEANGDTATTTATLPVTVQAVADTPKLQLNANAAGVEDSAIAIDFSAKLTDTDGSESLSAIIEDVPDGALLSAGTKNADGSWTVDAADFSGLTITPPTGSDSNFELKITAVATESEGDTAQSTSFTMPVTVEAVADETVFTSDASGDEDTAIDLNLSVNLTDTDGSETMSDILISGMPEGATLSAGEENLDGSWTVSHDQLEGLQITPPENSGDNFNLNVKVTTTEQASGATTTSQYSLPVEVNAVADAPLITASAVTGDEDTAIALNIATSLTDTDGSETLSALTIAGVPEGAVLSAGTNNNDGSWTVDSNQLDGLTLTPPADSHDDFTLSLSTVSTEQEGDSATTSTSVDITVTPVNDDPEAADDTATTSEDTALTLQSTDLLANDNDVDGDSLAISSVQDAEHGTVSLNDDKSITFTPDDNYNGPASFTYTVSDGQGGTDTATVQLAISSVNDVPVIEVVDTTATEDTAQVVANVSDIDGTIDSSSLSAEHGSVSLGENGDITYTPDANYNGTDTIQIEVTDDSGATTTKSVTVDVAAVNDAPTAADDTGLATAEDTQLTIPANTLLGNDEDVDGDTLSIASVQDVEHGTARVNSDGSVSFTPEANYNGDASFSYTVSDGQGGEDTATVHLKVSAVQDSISIITDTDAAANAVDENAATGTSIGITASAMDIDAGDTVSYSLANDADGRFAIDSESGKITVADGTKLDHEANDLHLISVKATSSDGSSSTQNYAVTINDVNENITPTAVDDISTTDFTLGENLIVNGSFENATITNSNEISDLSSDVEGWTISNATNQLEIINHDQVKSRDIAQDLTSETDGNNFIDFEGASGNTSIAQTVEGIEDGKNYQLSFDIAEYTGYEHSRELQVEWNGEVVGTFTADSKEMSTQTVTLTGGSGDDSNSLVFTEFSDYDHTGTLLDNIRLQEQIFDIQTQEDTELIIDVLANDSDADGDNLVITTVGNPTDDDGNIVGTTEIITENGTQQVRFTPGASLSSLNDGESAKVTFNYTIDDGMGGTDTATTTVVVQGTDNALTFISESAGYQNVVGIYEVDGDGTPTSATVVVDDQNSLEPGTHLANLSPGNYEFFIIANGSSEVNSESELSFDTSGEKPVLLIDGEPAEHPVYFTEPGFNPDGKDHFQFRPDGEGGTYIHVEDLPYLGDADFGDVVLHTDFEMDDRTAVGPLSDSDQTVNRVAENASAGTPTGITATAEDVDGDTVSFSLSDDAGGRFTIDEATGEVTVAEGAALDFETATSHNITVTATSEDGTESSQDYTIEIEDVQENMAPIAVDDTTQPVEVSTTNTVFSSSFESVTSTGNDVFHDSVDGWTGSNKIEVRTIEHDNGEAADGTQYVELNDDALDHYDDAPSISRSFETNDSGTYNLSFQYSARPGYDASVCRFEVVLDGEVLGTFSADGSNLNEPSWHNGSLEFPGNGNPAKLEFREAGTDIDYGRGAFIDNIVLEETVINTSEQAIVIDEDSSITINVLTNDVDIEGDTLTITQIQGQEVIDGGKPVEITDGNNNVLGTAQLYEGKVQFNPIGTLQNLKDDQKQDVAFEYTVSDGQGGTDNAKIQLTVTGKNDINEVIDIEGDINNSTNNVEPGDYIGNLTTGDGHDTISIGDDIADARTVSTHAGDDIITVSDDIKEGSVVDTGAGNDTLTVGDDVLNASSIITGSGNDAVTVRGNLTGSSTINTGSGDDQITIGGTADGSVDGGEGIDTIALSGNEADYNIVKNGDNSYQVQQTSGSRDDILNVSNVEEFKFADATVDAGDLTLTSNLIDGAVEGVEYTTSSGLHGFTDADGGFDFKDGDAVTFNIGGIVLGTATAEDVATGKTFLQDVADVARTDLNDEYLENMATFLQSIDENSDAYDGIVVTDEIREALADITLDLKTATEEEVGNVVEQLGQTLVSEEQAMEHVEDMLVAHTDLDHDDFDEHIADTPENLEQSMRSEQKQTRTASVISSVAGGVAAGSAAAQDFGDTESSDLSLNLPSLDLPGEREESSEASNQGPPPEQTEQQKANTASQGEVQELADESIALQDSSAIGDDDLSGGLPSVSLSNLFEDPASEIAVEDDTATKTEKNEEQDTQGQSPQATDVTTSENTSETLSTAQQNETEEIEEAEVAEGISIDPLESEEELTGETVELTTDELAIDIEDSGKTETEQEEDNSLDQFIADGRTIQSENNGLEKFSATGDSAQTEEMTSVDEIDTHEAENSDQVEEAGLSADDGIQEELPQDAEQTDLNVG